MKSDITMSAFNFNIEKTLNVKEQVEKLSMDIFCSDYIQTNLGNSNEAITDVEFSNAVKRLLKNVTNNVLYMNYIGVFGKNGKLYKSNWSYDELFTDYDSCNIFMKENGVDYLNKWLGPQKNLYYGSLRDQYAVFYFQVIRNISTLEEIGVLVIGVSRSSFLTSYNSDGTCTFILDGDGRGIASVNDNLQTDDSKPSMLAHVQSMKPLSGYYRSCVAGTEYLIFFSKIPDNSWYIFSLVPYSVIVSDSLRIGIVTAVILAVFIFLAVGFSFLITDSLTRPIMRLYRLMDKVKEGDLTVRFEAGGSDEIHKLGENFNQMIETLDNYLNEIHEQQRSMKTSQMCLMQAQVNPHMLYNTMDSLQYYIKKGKIDRANAILDAVSRFFRISLSHGDVLIPLRDEIAHVQSYIDIQNNCFNSHVVFKIDIPEELMDHMMIKMTLQPIVENSILHGFKNFRDAGEIAVAARIDKTGTFVLTVTDNGMGIMEDPLASLNTYLASEDDSADVNRPFGIINVNRRIKHFFGPQYGMRIESEFGVFTRVVITMPETFSEK